MAAHILFIDALSNRRIQMRAKLGTQAFNVTFAETLLEGLARIREAPPDIVILAYDLPGLKLPKLCRLLRSKRETQLVSIIVAVPCENHSARISALTAGAHDLIEFSAESPDICARLRSILRQRHDPGTGTIAKEHVAAQGLAEVAEPFEDLVRATVLVSDPDLAPPAIGPLLDDTEVNARLADIRGIKG